MEELSGESKESRRLRDRWKDAIKEREVKKTVLTHWHENKQTYIVAVLCVAGTALAMKKGSGINQGIRTVVQIGDNHNVTLVHLQDRTNYAQPVRCLNTGEVFGSQKRAADANGINQGELSRHLAGERETAGGFLFERL